MICGIGTDIAEVKRFSKFLSDDRMIKRFFSPEEYEGCLIENEQISDGKKQHCCEHLAVRFAAKEAFVKALGTGFTDFSLKEIYITNQENGKPILNVTGKADEKLKELYGSECRIHVSLSHEKEYAVAFVIIEKD